MVFPLDDDGRTFTVFAQHATVGPAIHQDYFTTSFELKPELPADRLIRC